MPPRSDVDSDDALAAALAYAALGWRVVPTPRESKHPRLPAWQDIASVESEQIIDWWGSTYHEDGISIVCGPSGLVVIDIDRHGPIDGEDTLADLVVTYGRLPDTPCVLTGGGGRHLYFRAPSGVTITNDAGKRLGPGLDVRADGGQVVAPPSRHASGESYRWEASSLPSDAGIFAPEGYVDLAPLPAWLLRLLTEPPPARPRSVVMPERTDLPGQQWAAVTDWGDLLTADGASYLGTRTHHATSTAYELWARPGVDHISATLGYGGSDVLKVFSTNWPGLDAEATYTKFGYLAATKYGGDYSKTRQALESQGYKTKGDDGRYLDVESLIAKADPEPRRDEAGKRIRPKPRNAAWLQHQVFPELRFHVPHLVAEGLTLLVGPPKIGKSWLVLGWALAVAAGSRLMGAESVPERPVLYLALEDSDRRLQSRLRKLTLPLVPFPEALDYHTEVEPDEVIDTMLDWLDGYGQDSPLVILDTLGKVLPPSVSGESAYQRDYRVTGALKKMIDRTDGGSLVITHHDRKAAAEDFVDAVSGTHGIAGAADATVVLSRKRHSAVAVLQVTGRDVDEAAYAIDFNGGAWVLQGGSWETAAAEAQQTMKVDNLGARSRSVLDFIEEHPDGVRWAQVAATFDFDVRNALNTLERTGRIRKVARGLYVPAELAELAGVVPLFRGASDGPDAEVPPVEGGTTPASSASSDDDPEESE